MNKYRLYYLVIIFLVFLVFPGALNSNQIHPPKNFQYIKAPLNKTYPLIPGAYFKALRKWKKPNITWFWIHNDEYDAKANTIWAYQNLGGYALLLLNRSNKFSRNLGFYIRGKGRFLLDPNRMFHIKGIENNLRLLNTNKAFKNKPKPIISYTWKHIGIKARKILLQYWSTNKPLIAIHNNRYLSIKKYRNDPKNFELAEFVTNPSSTFVFVTNKIHFKKLKSCRINTIYQLKSQKDGSLSDFAIQNKLPYVNVETKIGHKAEQQKILLKIAYTLFPDQFKNHPLLKENPCEI